MTDSTSLTVRPSMDLGDWYPLLAESGVATPETRIVQTDVDLSELLNERKPEGFGSLVRDVQQAAAEIGFPVFLRTGYGADPRAWSKTCFLRSPEDVPAHIYRLVRWSHADGEQPLPTTTWVLREILPLRPAFITHGGKPVTRQRRYFINSLGQVTGHQPVLTDADIADGNPRGPKGPLDQDQWQDALDALNHESAEEIAHLTVLSAKVAETVVGDWAVDWIYAEDRGWVCYDLTHFEAARIDHDYPSAPYTYRQPGSVPLDERDGETVAAYDAALPTDVQDLYDAEGLIDDSPRA